MVVAAKRMKTCSKCGKERHLEFFYAQKRRKDGKHPWCKECCKKHQKANAKRRLEQESFRWFSDPEYRERRRNLQRNWSAKNIEYKRMKEKENRLKNPEPYKKRVKEYAERNKEEIRIMARARQRVYTAVKNGKLTRLDHCEECGRKCKTEGAHYDYNEPLKVKWLCRSCHAKWDYYDPKIMKKANV